MRVDEGKSGAANSGEAFLQIAALQEGYRSLVQGTVDATGMEESDHPSSTTANPNHCYGAAGRR